jgi:hypothetical protein
MAECAACTRPCTDTTICQSCQDDLAVELRTVPWLVEQLEVTLTRQARVGERNGPRSAERPLVFHLNASIDLEALRDALTMWARAVAQQRQIRVDAARDPIALSRWMLRWMGAIATHTDAAELHGDITGMIRSARQTIDRPAERRYIGPCDDCHSDLYVVDHGNGRLPDTVTCRAMVDREDGTHGPCAAAYPMAERRAWLLEAAMNQLLTPAEITRAIGELLPNKRITANLISQWAARGLRIKGDRRQLTPYAPHPQDVHKRTRYRVEEVVEFYWAANKVGEKQEIAA